MFTLDPAFLRPSYDQNCFTTVPASIGALLGAPGAAALPGGFLPGRPRTFRAVVLILLDGFGWRFFEKVADDYPALRRFAAASGVAKFRLSFPPPRPRTSPASTPGWRSGKAASTSGSTTSRSLTR